jgi:hypothetical protein
MEKYKVKKSKALDPTPCSPIQSNIGKASTCLREKGRERGGERRNTEKGSQYGYDS